jgi:hypothetical protein
VIFALVATAVVSAPLAGADPDPSPGPIYSVPGGGLLGPQPLPARCGEFPQLCNLNWNPDTGTWQPRGG